MIFTKDELINVGFGVVCGVVGTIVVQKLIKHYKKHKAQDTTDFVIQEEAGETSENEENNQQESFKDIDDVVKELVWPDNLISAVKEDRSNATKTPEPTAREIDETECREIGKKICKQEDGYDGYQIEEYTYLPSVNDFFEDGNPQAFSSDEVKDLENRLGYDAVEKIRAMSKTESGMAYFVDDSIKSKALIAISYEDLDYTMDMWIQACKDLAEDEDAWYDQFGFEYGEFNEGD